MDDRLEIYTLGSLSIRLDSEPITDLVSRKAEALLVYLAANPRAHPREVLAEMLWEERSQSQAMTNLRVVLSSLRKHLGDYLDIDRDHARVDPHAQVWLDTKELEQALAKASQADGALTPEGRAFFDRALSLYQGSFLEGFYARQARGFERWQQIERERLQGLLAGGLEDRVEECLNSGQYRYGLTLARCLLELEPLMEAPHSQMVRLLAYSGQTEAALEQYKRYAENLQSELGAEPTQEMQDLYDRLLGGELLGQRAAEGEMAREPRAVDNCPYRGLAAFREADAKFFFGREAFQDQLHERVQTQAVVTVVVGSSGAGKSSLVYAGLLPRLRAADWLIIPFRPGGTPFSSLAGALMPHLEPDRSETERLVERGKLVEAWHSGELGLIPVLERVAHKSQKDGRLLLAVDQFEELYTLCPEPEEQRRFLDLLLAAFGETDGLGGTAPFHLLLSLRADFMGLSLAHRPFADALQRGALLLGPMSREELRAAIEQPAEMQGVGIEAGLVGRILDDLGKEPGSLPLLEFTLTLLWEHLEEGWMTHAAYESIGGVQGALARYADDVYGELEGVDQARLRRVMVQLVQPGQGTEDTRRIGRRDEFEERDWRLISLLADRRLVVTGRDEGGEETVEVVHEALIQRWGRLREWMREDREFRSWQESLRAALRGWEASGRDSGGLLRGVPLLRAEEWFAQRDEDLSPVDRAYLQASLEEREARLASEKARQERERALEQRSIRRLRVIVAVLVVASIIGITLTLAVLNQNRVARRNETLAEQNAATAQAEALARATQQAIAESEQERAEGQARLAFSRELAAAAQNNLEEEQERAVLLAMHALKQADTQEARDVLHQAIGNLRLLRTLESPGSAYAWSFTITLSPDGQRLVISGSEGASVWDVTTGEELYVIHEDYWISQAAFSPDGALLVTPNETEEGGTISILDAKTGEELVTFPAHETAAQHIAFNPDGTLFASVGYDSRIRIWDLEATLETGQPQQRFELSDEFTPIWTVNFSPDGSRLVTTNEEGVARVWDLASRQELFSFDSQSITFSPDGIYLISGKSPEGTLDVRLASTGQLISSTKGHSVDVWSVVFSPDGTLLASGGSDSLAKIWSFSEGALQPLMTLAGHDDRVQTVAFSRDGTRLFSSSLDGTVNTWDITPGGRIEPGIYPHDDLVQGLAIDPSGDLLATASYDGTAKIWRAASGELLHTLSGHSGPVTWLAFSPDGTTLATGGDDATVILWEVATGRQLATLQAHVRQETGFNRGIFGFAFSPDGKHLATTGADGAARVWEVASLLDGDLSIGDELFNLEGHDPGEWITDVAYSPDGSYLATSSFDETITVWEAETGQAIWVIKDDPPRRYWRVTFSPDSSRVAAGDYVGMATVWDLPDQDSEDPEKLLSITAGQTWVGRPAFSPDGDYLALPHSEGLGIWDARTGEPWGTFPHPDSVGATILSPDGERLYSGSYDGLARLFYLDIEELFSRVHARLTRDLTIEECQKYLHMEACPPLP